MFKIKIKKENVVIHNELFKVNENININDDTDEEYLNTLESDDIMEYE